MRKQKPTKTVLALGVMIIVLSVFSYASIQTNQQLQKSTDPVCGLTDVTASITNLLQPHIITDNMKIKELGDPQKRYHILTVYDTGIQETVWKMLDLGADKQLGTADDQVYNGDALTNIGYFIGEMSRTTTNEKLFYLLKGTRDEIWSCDLPTCANKVREVAIQPSIQGIVPSLHQNRIYITKETSNWYMRIDSCSRNQQHLDYCGAGEGTYRQEYLAPVPERTLFLRTFADTGILLYDTQATYKYKFLAINAIAPSLLDINSITQINQEIATRFTGTAFLMFDSTSLFYPVYVAFFDGNSGNTHYLEQIPQYTQGLFIGLDSVNNRIKYIYRTDPTDPTISNTYIKEPNGNAKLIKDVEEGSIFEKFFMLHDGTVLAITTDAKLKRFDCTP